MTLKYATIEERQINPVPALQEQIIVGLYKRTSGPIQILSHSFARTHQDNDVDEIEDDDQWDHDRNKSSQHHKKDSKRSKKGTSNKKHSSKDKKQGKASNQKKGKVYDYEKALPVVRTLSEKNTKKKGGDGVLQRSENSCYQAFQGHKRSPLCFTYMDDYLYSSGQDNTIIQWDPILGKERSRVTPHTGPIQVLASVPHHDLIISGSHDRTIAMHRVDDETKELQITTRLMHHGSIVMGLAVDQNRDVLFSGSTDETVRYWDLNRIETYLEDIQSMDNAVDLASPVTSVCYNSQHSLLFAATAAKSIEYFDVRTVSATAGNNRATLGKEHYNWINYLCNRKHHELWSCGQDGLLIGWDLRVLKPFVTFSGHDKNINCIAVSERDSNIVYTGSHDRTVRVWNVDKQYCEAVIKMNLEVNCLIVQRDERREARSFTRILKSEVDVTRIFCDIMVICQTL